MPCWSAHLYRPHVQSSLAYSQSRQMFWACALAVCSLVVAKVSPGPQHGHRLNRPPFHVTTILCPLPWRSSCHNMTLRHGGCHAYHGYRRRQPCSLQLYVAAQRSRVATFQARPVEISLSQTVNCVGIFARASSLVMIKPALQQFRSSSRPTFALTFQFKSGATAISVANIAAATQLVNQTVVSLKNLHF